MNLLVDNFVLRGLSRATVFKLNQPDFKRFPLDYDVVSIVKTVSPQERIKHVERSINALKV